MSINILNSFGINSNSFFDRLSSITAKGLPRRQNHEGQVTKQPAPPENISDGKPVLDSALLDELNKVFSKNGVAPIRSPEASGYTPDDVANRIINHISQVLNQRKDDGLNQETLAQLFNEAKEGIERGFKQAQEFLATNESLQTVSSEQLDQTHTLLEKGMSKLEDHLFGPVPVTEFTPDQTINPMLAEQSLSTQLDNNRSFSMEIETNDGDLVTISLTDRFTFNSLNYDVTDGKSQLAFAESQIITSSNFSLSISGNLDEGELEAIGRLMHRVENLADKFFAGDLQTAFEKASRLELDTNELAAFNLNLEMMQAQKASSTYQSVGQLGDQIFAPSQIGNLNDIANISQFLNDIEEARNDMGTKNQFKETGELFEKLFEGAVKIIANSNELSSDSNETRNTNIDDILSKLFQHPGDKHNSDHHHKELDHDHHSRDKERPEDD
ncbi:MAG: DUF5610 domain-containing protein [Gammaproteobacteria bacterium]